MDKIVYWLQERSRQNFGDALSRYLAEHLFLQTARRTPEVRLLGSVLHDWFVPPLEGGSAAGKNSLVAWGGGIREPGGLSEASRDRVQILSVRGPVSASELALGSDVPMGDPGLLLPALYPARPRPKFAGKTICIPHFHDLRSDQELLDICGADLVLRASIENTNEAIEDFIDALVSASFVLSSSLHGAIVAAAYGRPFAFWDPGFMDLPTKWQDFARSVDMPGNFVTDVATGRTEYENRIRPAIRIPSMLESLATAPYPLRPEALLRVLDRELAGAGNESRARMGEAIRNFDRRRGHFGSIASESRALVQELEIANNRMARELEASHARLAEERETLLRQLEEIGGRLSSERAASLRQLEELAARSAHELEATTAEVTKAREQLHQQVEAAHRQRDELTQLLESSRVSQEEALQAERARLREAGEAAERQRDELTRLLESSRLSQEDAFQAERARLREAGEEAQRRHQSALQAQQQEVADSRQQAAALQARLHALDAELAAARAKSTASADALHSAQRHARAQRRTLRGQLLAAQEEQRQAHIPGAGWRAALRSSGRYGYDVLHNLGLAKDRRAAQAIAKSGLFDPRWYATVAGQAFGSAPRALLHYLEQGAAQGLSPHPLFDPAHYATQAGNVAAQGENPLLHYVRFGCWEGRQPHALFDPAFYLDANPDVEEAGAEPLGHYLRLGWREGRRPHPLFDPSYYLAANDDVRALDCEPLCHYVEHGAREGRAPSGFFHAQGYAFDHPDVADFDGNALLHYLWRGRATGCSPHPLFDPAFYAQQNADVDHSGLTPFEHYVVHGAREGRPPSRMWAGERSIENAHIAMPPFAGVPEVTVVVPVYKNFFDTFRCLFSIAAHASPATSMQVVLADDCPARPVAPLFEQVANLSIISHPENLGFLRGCNRAASMTQGEYIVFLNNDTWVSEGWLDRMLDLARRDPAVAMVGSKLLNADGTIQEAGGVMFKDGWGFPYGRGGDPTAAEYSFVREVDCVIGACFLVRRSCFEEVGGLNELYSPAFYEEFDLAFAVANAGYRVMYQPASIVYHLGSCSYGAEMRDRQSSINHEKFAARWAARLSTQHEDASSLFLARSRPRARGVILVIDDMVPEYDKHAGALTMFQYLRLLTTLDFTVIYLPHNRAATWPYTGTYQQLGIEVLYGDFSPAQWLAANGRFIDHVWVARPDVANSYIDDIRRYTSARLAYYTHDLHFLREQRRHELDGDAWALSESQRLRPIETAIFQRVDVVTTPSADEAAVIRELAPGCDVRVIPPYFFEPAGARLPTPPAVATRDKIVFVGGYRHTPNVDAAVFLVKEVMPLVWDSVPHAQVMLAGSHPPREVLALAGPRVQVVGFVEDLGPVYDQARMSVSALRWGAGVKGKIVGSLEAGVPAVTTTIGNEGIGLVDGQSVLLGDTAEALASAVVRLYREPGLLESLAREGLRVIAQRFSVASARAAVLDFLDLAGREAGVGERPSR